MQNNVAATCLHVQLIVHALFGTLVNQALGFLICFSCRRQHDMKLHSRNSLGLCLPAWSLLMLRLDYVATLGNKKIAETNITKSDTPHMWPRPVDR